MSDTPREGGTLASVKGLMATLVATLKTRLELFATEVEEEKLRLGRVLVLGAAAAFLLGLGILFLFIFLALLFWESRLLVFGAATLLFLGGGWLAWTLLQREYNRYSGLFAASLEELSKDLDALDARTPGDTRP